MHLKHCSSDHNTSRDLEFDKNVPRLVTTGAINLKKKQSEGNTLLCYEYLFYINTQGQMSARLPAAVSENEPALSPEISAGRVR